MERWAIEIDRDDITTAQLVGETEEPLPDGSIEVRIDLFAMTANNVTYAALGHPGLFAHDKGYWDFFSDRDTPGRLPVWGFATVTASNVPALPTGETLYGYWPLASHARLRPERVNAVGFVDGTERRRLLPAFYNRYQRISALDDYAPADHEYWPVFRPLYLTGWLIADQLAEAGDYGADRVLVTAASSKTAMGFAHAYRQRDGARPEVIGLTSPTNVPFVAATGLYDNVVAYTEIEQIDVGPAALIDVAGNADVTRRIHGRFGEALKLSLVVGKAHWDAEIGDGALAGPRKTGFFAPSRIEKRAADWGGEGLREAMSKGWISFMRDAHRLTSLDRRSGGDAALVAYREVVSGRSDPAASILVTGESERSA